MANFKRMHGTQRRNDPEFHSDFKPNRRTQTGRPNRDEPRFERDEFRPTRKEETQTICARCGKVCTVPFRPSNNKPVYCSDCFRKNDSSEYQRPSYPHQQSSHSSSDLADINNKLDKIMRALKIN